MPIQKSSPLYQTPQYSSSGHSALFINFPLLFQQYTFSSGTALGKDHVGLQTVNMRNSHQENVRL